MKLREIRKQLAEFRAMDAARLNEQLTALKKEQFNLRFQQATGQLEKTSRIGQVRDQVARIMTVLREKQPAKHV